MEQADTRRGKPCWYLASDLVSNAGVALNDASFVETGIYQLLKMHFKDKPYYVDVLELFHDVSNVRLTTLNLYSTHYNHHNTNNAFYIIYICVIRIICYELLFTEHHVLLLRTMEVLVSNLSFLTVQADVFCGIPKSPMTFLG